MKWGKRAEREKKLDQHQKEKKENPEKLHDWNVARSNRREKVAERKKKKEHSSVGTEKRGSGRDVKSDLKKKIARQRCQKWARVEIAKGEDWGGDIENR